LGYVSRDLSAIASGFRAMFMTLPSELPGFAVWKASRGP
jgi:hypothetical protein